MEPEDIKVTKDYGDDWSAAEDARAVVLMDKRLTEELTQEGLARDVVRFVQVARKEAGLELEDRIVLSLQTDSGKLKAAIEACKNYIAAETLATEVTHQAPDNSVGTSAAKIGGKTSRIIEINVREGTKQADNESPPRQRWDLSARWRLRCCPPARARGSDLSTRHILPCLFWSLRRNPGRFGVFSI